MFELFIARKYLVPKKRQLSVSLIALMSVAVISLVVWLVLLFLSITVGIEKGWLQKLTSLNAPLRIVPTAHYYNSYYYHVDAISSLSNYSHKSLREKLQSPLSDPYSVDEDQEVPSFWPKPDLGADGNLKDPVKELFASLDQLKKTRKDLVAEDYEVTGALLKLRLLRPVSNYHSRDDKQSFLTQMSYIASFSEKNPTLPTLLLPPTKEDLNHLLYLTSFSTEDPSLDRPQYSQKINSSLFQERLRTLLDNIDIKKMKSTSHHFELSPDYFSEGTEVQVVVYVKNQGFSHILIPKEVTAEYLANRNYSSSYLKYGTLQKKEGHLYFTPYRETEAILVDFLPLYVDETLEFNTTFIPSSIDQAYSFDDIKMKVRASLQNKTIEGISSWSDLEIEEADVKNAFNASPSQMPVWPYFIDKSCHMPSFSGKDHGILLPKNFRDSGVRIGDKGYVSYGVATANSMQEQRLTVYVAGFYDPGIMQVGAKCILMNHEVVHDIAISSNSFALDHSMSTGVQVWFQDLKSAKDVAAELRGLLQEKGVDNYFEVLSFYDYDFAKDLLQQFQSDKYLFTLIGIIILIVACSNIISFLVLMVNDKKREIGILQAMGASSKSIAAIFAICGASLGMIGSALGTVGALFTMHYIDKVVRVLSFLQGREAFHENFYGNSLPNVLSFEAVLFILISTPIISFIAGLIPAIKACRLRPAAILRSE